MEREKFKYKRRNVLKIINLNSIQGVFYKKIALYEGFFRLFKTLF
jgi:hypothetical protein